MSTQRKNRRLPLAALLGGIVLIFPLLFGSTAKCSSTISIQFSAPTQSPEPRQTANPQPSSPAATGTARPGGAGGSGAGGGGAGGGKGTAENATDSSVTAPGEDDDGYANTTAPTQPRLSEKNIRWRVYTGMDLHIGATPRHVASVYMRTGTVDFSFANSKPRPEDVQPADYQLTFAEDGRQILGFVFKEDALPPGTTFSWPDPADGAPSVVALLRPFVVEAESYLLDVTTVMVWD